MDINKAKIIMDIIYELTITIYTVILAWPKIKKYFYKEKKSFLNKIKINKHLLKYFKIQKNIIIEI